VIRVLKDGAEKHPKGRGGRRVAEIDRTRDAKHALQKDDRARRGAKVTGRQLGRHRYRPCDLDAEAVIARCVGRHDRHRRFGQRDVDTGQGAFAADVVLGPGQGGDLAVDATDGVKINDATVVTADIAASNGVIHVIDTVVMPKL